MNVALYSGIDNDRPVGRIASLAGHVRFQYRDCVLHYFSRLDYLWQKHFACSEEFTDTFHSGHQRTFDDFHGCTIFMITFHDVCLQAYAFAFHQRLLHTIFGIDRNLGGLSFYWCGSSGGSGFLGLLGRHYLLGLGNQALGGFGVAVQNHVFGFFQQVRFDVVVDLEHARIHDSHVETGLHAVVEEDGMHGLTDGVVTAECDRFEIPPEV